VGGWEGRHRKTKHACPLPWPRLILPSHETHSYCFNECSLFLELRLAFDFHLDLCSDLVISFYQGVFLPLVHVGFHQKSCFKKVRMVLEKRKSFMQKSGTRRSLCRLWPRLLHIMLDVFLIVCLVVLL
jgi:hypothetical protein